MNNKVRRKMKYLFITYNQTYNMWLSRCETVHFERNHVLNISDILRKAENWQPCYPKYMLLFLNRNVRYVQKHGDGTNRNNEND